MNREAVIAMLNRNGFSTKPLELNPDGSERTLIITHEYTPDMSLGIIEPESLSLKKDVLPPGSMRMIHLPFEVQDDTIRLYVQHLHKIIENPETRIRLGRVNDVKKYFKERRDMVKMLEKTRYDLSRGYQV